MDDNNRVGEWESGLPSTNDLTPLSQPLISPELASAFSISAEPYKNMVDVNRASQTTIENIRRQNSGFCTNTLKSFMEDRSLQEENECLNDSTRKIQRIEEAVDEGEWDECSAKASKRVRLVWTPQLHKRFVDVVAHLGIKSAVPKNIMQLMNVEGLTRENVASHLQKYRLYLKRMQGLSDEPPSASDNLSSAGPMAFSAYGAVSNVGMVHPYNMYTEQQGDWSANKFASVVPYSHGNRNNK